MSLRVKTITFGIGFEILLSENQKNNSYHLKNGGLNYVTSI
jgi:hypothetical protein